MKHKGYNTGSDMIGQVRITLSNKFLTFWSRFGRRGGCTSRRLSGLVSFTATSIRNSLDGRAPPQLFVRLIAQYLKQIQYHERILAHAPWRTASANLSGFTRGSGLTLTSIAGGDWFSHAAVRGTSWKCRKRAWE